MSKFSPEIQSLMLKAVWIYVDDQADDRIRNGANQWKARLLSTVLGNYLFEDLVAEAEAVKTFREGGSMQETMTFLQEAIAGHSFDKVMLSCFDATADAYFSALFDQEEAQMAMARMQQFKHQLQSSWSAEIQYIQRKWKSVVDDFLLLDRRWFQFSCNKDQSVPIAEKRSDRLRRYIHAALKELRRINQEVDNPENMLKSLLTTLRYVEEMQQRGIDAFEPEAKPPQSKRKPGGGGFGKGGG